MKKADWIIIIVLLVLAAGGYGASKLLFNHKYTSKYVEIDLKGKLYQKVLIPNNKFKKTIKIKTELGYNIIEIENGGAVMHDADCPDKICLKEGFKDKVGQTIVCLPHRVVVEIKGSNKPKTEPDGVAY